MQTFTGQVDEQQHCSLNSSNFPEQTTHRTMRVQDVKKDFRPLSQE